jgi:hypothetical protein
MLQPEIVPYISRDVKFGTLPQRIRERIAASDCLIAIITDAGSSAFVQNEVGIAFALDKPIFAIYEDRVEVGGIQPYLSTHVKYHTQNMAAISTDIVSLKTAIGNEISSRELGGSPQGLLDVLSKNGILGIYPDRATAFRVFEPIWEREHDIKIVGSSTEGFKRGIGIEARELLMGKLAESHATSTIRILLTHSSFAKYREAQERELDGYILAQIRATDEMLSELRERTHAEDRLQWRFFKGAPTCFMIMAGNFMLLNPYLYMQPAYFNFSMIVRDTKSPFDIYSHYSKYHFQRAWDDPTLTTSDSGLDTEAKAVLPVRPRVVADS